MVGKVILMLIADSTIDKHSINHPQIDNLYLYIALFGCDFANLLEMGREVLVPDLV